MLVGHTFDDGGDMMDVISKLGKQGVPYPEYVTPYCKLIINKCLNLDPAKRISLKNLIDLIKDRKNVDNSDFIKRQSQKQIEQPTAAQIPQMQKAMLQQPMVSPSQLQQQKMLHQRSIKNSTQNQQPVSLPQPQQ
jgi:serine/threonine protein kinase